MLVHSVWRALVVLLVLFFGVAPSFANTQGQCNDGLDNDGDGLIDYPFDPGCYSLTDLDEANPLPTVACNDGLDNDGDGLIDHPDDPGCFSLADPDENNSQLTQCSDGIDNDADGSIDFPSDSGCSSHSDDDERGRVQSCRLSRQIELQSAQVTSQNVLSVDSHNLASDYFSNRSCGPHCIEYTVGKVGNNTWYRDPVWGCKIVRYRVDFTVHQPGQILSASLHEVGYDDYTSVRLGNQLKWSDPVGWMGGLQWGTIKPGCSDNSRARTPSHPHGRFRGSIDVTSLFTGTAPGGQLRFEQTVFSYEEGEGWAILQIRFREQCTISREHISGDCSSLNGNPLCSLRQEVVDGVTTVDEYRVTGRSQGQSGKSLSSAGGGCTRTIQRPWWEKERTYSCTGDQTGKAGLPACADGGQLPAP